MARVGAMNLTAVQPRPAIITTARTGTEVEHIDQSGWDALAPRFHDYNVRQMWEYGVAIAQRQRATSEHVAIRNGNRLVALACVRIKTMPLIGGGIAYVSGGPLTRADSPK